MVVTKSKQSRLLEALTKGRKLTAAQIQAQFGIANPSATVSDIRQTGRRIEIERTTSKSGTVTSKYFLA